MGAPELIAQAREWVGVPFRHQGRSRHGVDCIGLVVCVFRELGITIPDRTVYDRETDDRLMLQVAREAFTEVQDMQPGDMLQMKFGNNWPTPHVAIYTGHTIIHSYYKPGKVVEQTFRDGRPARLERIMRYAPWLRS